MSSIDAANSANRQIPGRPDGPVSYEQSVTGCLEPTIGAHGLTPAELAPFTARSGVALVRLADAYRDGSLPLLQLADETADIEAAEAAYIKLADGARSIIFFGTGGSALGGQTLAQLAGWNIPGQAMQGQRKRPRTRFYDNLDPATLQGGLSDLDLANTRFVVTSKSGGTAETLAQAIAALSAVDDAGLGDKASELFLGITEPAKPGVKNGLRDLFAARGIPMLEHHTGVGGRYSCLTNVGLLPAIARGLDVRALRAGARDVIDAMLANEATPERFAPAEGAAVTIAMSKLKGVRTLVMMPYADKLNRFSDWFVQLWAESLGKNGEGTSPIGALGPLDQHSQLQLFMDGPHEHMLTVLRVAQAGTGPVLDPAMAKLAGADYMAGRMVGDIVAAQSYAVPKALGRAGRAVREIDIPNLDERALGALLMHFMIETILSGWMLEIDPFDQPAVELAKVLTRERLAETT